MGVAMSRRVSLLLAVAVIIGFVPAAQAARPADDWQQIAAESPWEARAGLQAVALDGQIFVMGGRTPTVAFYEGQPVPGASVVRSDVWATDDQGATWQERTPAAPWAARAYCKAVEHRGAMYVLGGQNFTFGQACLPPGGIPGGLPPGVVPTCSQFFNDVWKSEDGRTWTQVAAAAPWEGRAGLSAWSHRGALYVAGGSANDDAAIIGPGGPQRTYFDDVWRSTDGGRTWVEATDHAPWQARAGAATAVRGGFAYLIGGEDGFTCASGSDRCPPYFNDVWRTSDGTTWQLVTDNAGFSPRPGHQCLTLRGEIICFGGFGLPVSQQAPPAPPLDPTACIGEPPANPTDMWSSRDGRNWRQLPGNAWGSEDPADMRYDFASVVAPGSGGRAILTFGGDQETFCFADPANVARVVNDVWRFRPGR